MAGRKVVAVCRTLDLFRNCKNIPANQINHFKTFLEIIQCEKKNTDSVFFGFKIHCISFILTLSHHLNALICLLIESLVFLWQPEAPKPKDSGKKIRRKLPPIPADEEPATTPRAPAQKKSPSSSVPPAPSRKAPTIKAVKGSPHGDNETVSHKDDSSREAGHPSQSVKSTSSSLSGVGRTNGNHSLRANSAGNGSGTGPCTSKQKTVGGPNGTTSKGMTFS